MKDLTRVMRSGARLRSRLIIAEALARPGQGPLARRVGLPFSPSGSAAPGKRGSGVVEAPRDVGRNEGEEPPTAEPSDDA